MRVRLKGLHYSSFQRADGTTAKYYFAWRGGPRLNDEDGRPLTPSDPRFVAAFNAAHSVTRKAPEGDLAALVDAFRQSREFTSKAAKTRKDYTRYLDMIEASFGDMPKAAVEDKRARGLFKDWRDKVAAKSGDRTADYLWSVLARVLSVAKDRGRISVNVCERGGRLYEADRNDAIWTDEQETHFYETTPAQLHLPMMMALWLGQRQADLLKLTWNNYDGQYITLEQNKSRKGDKVGTGNRVRVPVGGPLKIRLDAEKAKKRGLHILLNSRGKPWTSDGFRTSWGDGCALAGVEGLTFHDLRGSAVVRLALSGCSVPEIATFTGHSLKTVEGILDAHYLKRDIRLADSAGAKLERRLGRDSA